MTTAAEGYGVPDEGRLEPPLPAGGGRKPQGPGLCPTHTCHILPFQPIPRNRCFPSKSVKSAQNSPKSISEGGRIWRVCATIIQVFEKATT